MVKVLLDTDIGNDIDDSLALSYLLSNPECDLVGITTVSGNPEARAQLADSICRTVGRKVPIHAGLCDPFIIPNKQPEVPQADLLPKWEHSEGFGSGFEAIVFMRDVIRANPGKINLLAIGPLTNVGALFALDPEIPSLLAGLYLMNGRFLPSTTTALGIGEWNTICDPHAAAIVYAARPKIFRCYGLDVTSKVTTTRGEFFPRAAATVLGPVRDYAERWFDHPDPDHVIYFHDPLAAMNIFHPEICVHQRGRVKIDTLNSEYLGYTIFTPDESGPIEIAADVNSKLALDEYFSVVK